MVFRNYSDEFRTEAVELYRSRPGVSIAQVAEDLGVDDETMRRWVRADQQRRGEIPAGPVAAAAGLPPVAGAVEEENAALRRRVRELEEERDILRKAAKYFAGETRW